MQLTQKQATSLTNPAETLRDAALYLRRYGWIQGCYYDPAATIFTPAADIAGAIGMVCYGGPSDTPALNILDPFFPNFEEAMDLLCRFLRVAEGNSDPYAFNDAKDREVWDVIGTLLDAANLADDLPVWSDFNFAMALVIRDIAQRKTAGGAA